MPSLTREIPHGSPQAREILQEVQRRVRFWQRQSSAKATKWREAEEKVLAYLPERDVDAARRTAREGGLPQYTTIQIPYSYAVVMAAYTYLTSVFMGRDPIFQYSGRHGESQQQVQALEALISYQVLVGQMTKHLHTWLYDPLKYGVGIVGVHWDDRIETVTTIQEQPQIDPITGIELGPPIKLQLSEQSRTYSGNRIYNLQPQDFIWDVRYTMREFQSGEFAGERRKLGWNEIIRRKQLGYYTNIEAIGAGSGQDYFNSDEGSSQLERPESMSSGSEGEMMSSRGHPLMVGIYQMIIEIIPEEWKLGASSYPEKWVFTVTDDFGVVLGVQPLGARHCKFPYSVIPFEPEGYGLTTRGLPEILEPVQNTVDWLINSHFYNVRAALNNKYVVDPSRVVMKDVLDPLPGGIIRLKPEAYGTDTKMVMTQQPIVDVTRTHLQDFSTMIGIGERVGGVNDQIMGMLSAGGRKTATEVRTSTSFGINRLKTTAEFASTVGFEPLSMILVQNTQQYYDMELMFKIAGDLVMNTGGTQIDPMSGMPMQVPNPGFIQVRPEDISGFYNFVPVDGTLPIDRFAQVSLWQELMQVAMTNPQIGMGYDWAGIFQWVAQLAGLKNITQFKVQLTPDALLAAQAQAGNIVPASGTSSKANGSVNPQSVSKPAVQMPRGIMQ